MQYIFESGSIIIMKSMGVKRLYSLLKNRMVRLFRYPFLIPLNIHLIQNLSEFRQKAGRYNSNNSQNEILTPIWEQNLSSINHFLEIGDLNNFLQWDVIKKTMFVSGDGYIFKELCALKNDRFWKSKWKKVLKEDLIGNPDPSFYYFLSSDNRIHHTYHIMKYENVTGQMIPDFERIIEFGGGYGDLCRIIKNLKFNGKYIIYDLLPFSFIQNYYLSNLGYNVLINEISDSRVDSILCCSQLNILKENMNTQRKTLFISTWGISEVPIELRLEIINLLPENSSFLLAFQSEFEEINNIDFFIQLIRKQAPKIQWNLIEIPHLKNNFYLFGYSH